ncbi:hypothetical protein CEXT_318111 [Caerostris extrusa]|uniref:Prokineticin domain-containing protein n=1 Tax=Caerostris extrusa TaxID=172846 RepID=A0AAV4YCH4_CAEEX|nr:hypothetical protein CEXT_318111 [Caerostris extrusa]
MNYFLSAIFFSGVLAVVSAQACIEQAECDASQCCAGVPPFGGLCQNFTAEGGKCHLVDRIVPIFGDFYVGPCPCAEGLVCIQQGKHKNNGICQLPPTTAAPTAADDSAADDSAAADSAADDSAAADSAADDSAAAAADESVAAA